MILDAVKTDTVFEVEVRNLNMKRVPVSLGFLRFDNGYSILVNNNLYRIEIIDENKLEEIDFFFRTRANSAIVNVVESSRDKFFTMEIVFFTYPVRTLFSTLYVALDEKIVETAKKQQIIKKRSSVDDLAKALKEKISFTINGEEYFLVSSGNSSKKEIFSAELNSKYADIKWAQKDTKLSDEEKDEKINNIKSEIETLKKEEGELAFSIFGDHINLPVKKDITQSGEYRFTATKLVSFKNPIKKDSLQLIKADIKLKSGLVSDKIARDLGDIVESDDSYLKKWDEYSKLEGEILLKKAKAIGNLKLARDPIKTDIGYDLKFESIPEELEVGDYLSFVMQLPVYIKEGFAWNDYIAYLDNLDDINSKEEIGETFEVVRIGQGFVSIKTDDNISIIQYKHIVVSIYGDKIQIDRKHNARKRLLEVKSANPFLGLIIEDSDKIQSYQRNVKYKRVEPLSDYVVKKIFPKNPPTTNQQEAIDIALNTPDIALIQGPPGTGKTTVLTAIIERLNELSDKSDRIKGEILVAGIQHDAVENIRSRLKINGLPTPKFGKKSMSEVDIGSFEEIMKWSQEIAYRVKERMPELSNQQKIMELQKYFEVYLKTPSQRVATKLLEYTLSELSPLLTNNTVAKVEAYLDQVNPQKKEDSLNELNVIYALRTTKQGFLDDGKERNQDLLYSSLGKYLTKEQRDILQDNPNDFESYLKKLQKLRYDLINSLYPKAIFKAEKPNSDIIKLKDEIEEELSSGAGPKDKIATVIANFLNDIENNPFALKSMIEEYSFVFAATTQQSMGKDIAKAKKNKDDTYITFDTVIIDEAARVSPMDLLIAMVQAKRRIILVGDHRQLPHLVDEEIIKDSELSEDDFIKKSMFGYLKDRANKLEEYDGIKRSITLNNQYRTHPLLGEFVSDSFYKNYNEAFQSPLKDIQEYFHQNLEGIQDIPAVWIDVNNSECQEHRIEYSLARKCEAKAIVAQLKKWILSEEGQGLTFGIITFYGAQRDLINDEIKKRFSETERDRFKDTLKVGTVDSFQGMEFDIVFLSTVRSRNINNISKKIEDYKLFGFLISKNRLCVSMSRQKKSLIVVGDMEFYESSRAKEDVSELYEFLQLCKREGKIL